MKESKNMTFKEFMKEVTRQASDFAHNEAEKSYWDGEDSDFDAKKEDNGKKPKEGKEEKKKDPFTLDVEDRLRKKFATRVEIGNKSITIRYTDIEDLNRILEIMDVIED